MSQYKMLKAAAAAIDFAAGRIEEQETRAKVASEKLAAADKTKTASEKESAGHKAELGTLAKVAADKLLESGLLSNAEKRDQFASTCLDHKSALAQLGKLASLVQAPKLGSVVAAGNAVGVEKTANQAWDERAAGHLARLGR